MKVTGIIAEYNPFHNGHKYHIEKAKELTGADYVIVVMSGNFTQRGIPAFTDKYTRTRMALSCGADLVLELPLYYAAGSAEYFATGAVSLLDRLGVVDSLCFGSECGNIDALMHVASVLYNEPDSYKKLLQDALKSGQNYPAARHNALLQYLSMQPSERDAVNGNAIDCDTVACAAITDVTDYEQILSSPNNILGIEYCKALLKLNSSITPYTIRREGGGYNDDTLSAVNSSALAIRTALSSKDNLPTARSLSADRSDASSWQASLALSYASSWQASLASIREQMPAPAYELLGSVYGKSAPVTASDLSVLLHYQLLLHESEGYTKFYDVSEEISNRIVNNLRSYKDFDSFCELLKTKEITYARISRALLHILLSMTKENMRLYTEGGYTVYARMLGFRKESAKLLSAIKKYADVQAKRPVAFISKLADAKHILSDRELAMLEEDIRAAHIYNGVVQGKFGYAFANEYMAEIVRI